MSDQNQPFPSLPQPPRQPPNASPPLPPSPQPPAPPPGSSFGAAPFSAPPGQPQYGQQQYGQQQFGQQQFGQQQFGQQQFGQPQYGLPQYGQPQMAGGLSAGGSGRSGHALAGFILGLLSIILFFTGVVPLLALIFGLIGASAVKKSAGRRTGLKMARAGWILGVLGLLGFAAVMTAVIVDAVHNAPHSLADLQIGHCYDLPVANEVKEISSLKEISCSKPHRGELYFQGTLNPDQDRSYPGQDKAVREARLSCLGSPFTSYVGVAARDSVYSLYVIAPAEIGWVGNKGAISCFVVDADDGMLTGSVKGTAR